MVFSVALAAVALWRLVSYCRAVGLVFLVLFFVFPTDFRVFSIFCCIFAAMLVARFVIFGFLCISRCPR